MTRTTARTSHALGLLAVLALVVVTLVAALPSTATAYAGTPAARQARPHDLVGEWGGHTRGLSITRDPVTRALTGVEEVGDGCCDPVVDVTLALSDVRGTRGHASARAEVLSVSVHDPGVFGAGHPAPQVGDVTRVRIRRNVLHEPLTRQVYCDASSARPWVCGA